MFPETSTPPKTQSGFDAAIEQENCTRRPGLPASPCPETVQPGPSECSEQELEHYSEMI